MKKALVAGTFDPITIGHMDIIQRARSLFDQVHIVIFVNPDKTPLFSLEERLAMLVKSCEGMEGVVVGSDDGMLVDYMMRNNIVATVRGVRNLEDAEYELDMAQYNKQLYSQGETIILPCSHELEIVSSNKIREALNNGQDVAKYLPTAILPLFNEMWRHKQGRLLPNADNYTVN